MKSMEMENVTCARQPVTDEWILKKYDLYKNMLFQIAFSYLGNKHDCEDIIQEAFIKLCCHAPEFEHEENEKRWLIRVTINLCKNHVHSFWHRMKENSDDALEQYFIHEDERRIMSDVIRLPDKYKTIILLYYIAGYKISEIAQTLKLSESAVKMRLKRGRELLKIELEDEV